MEENILYETKYWKIKLNSNQYYLGMCAVSLKRECNDLAELKQEEILDFLEIIKNLEKAIKKAFQPTLFNWSSLMNHAYKSENPKPQVHFLAWPRYKEKVNFAGEVFEDKEFTNHYDGEARRQVSKEVMNKIIEKIKENL